ncbi:MAG: SBBP repeat-containing protein, partial [Polyangiaceae bacterium]|nr:SBBP repeat-containing protein [Polyangiaceae bacterium]
VLSALGGCSDDETATSSGFTTQATGTSSSGSSMTSSGTGMGGDLFGTSSSTGGMGGAPVDCDDDKTDGPVQWSKGYGDGAGQYVHGTAVDSAGNVLVTGSFAGTVDFGGGPLTSSGGNDVFVAKFDANGQHIWSKKFGAAQEQSGRSIATDAAGNVYVTGNFIGSVNFGGGALGSDACCFFEDMFLMKLDAQGNFVWAKDFGDGAAQTARAVVSDAQGNIVMVGDFQGDVNFGGGVISAAGVGGIDIFVAKFTSAGAHVWSKAYGDAADQSAEEVVLDAAGNVIITGNAGGVIDFGTGPLTATGTKAALVAKLSAGGDAMWASLYGAEARGLGVDVDAAGKVAVAGAFKGTIDLGGGSLAGGGSNDTVFVALFDAQGKHTWSHAYGSGSAQGTSVAIDGKGKAIVGGTFSGAIDFGGSKLTSAGGFDAFLVKLDSVGCHVFSGQFGNEVYQGTQTVTLDASGNIVIAGNFAGTADFGAGVLTAAGDDIFVAKFGP